MEAFSQVVRGVGQDVVGLYLDPYLERSRLVGQVLVTLYLLLFLLVGAAEAALDFSADKCQVSQTCLTPGACVRVHLYNSMWALTWRPRSPSDVSWRARWQLL